MTERSWKRRAVGVATAGLIVTAANAPAQTATVMGLIAGGTIAYRVRRRGISRLNRLHIRPTVEVLEQALPATEVVLRVNRRMRTHVPGRSRPMSRLEEDLRHQYGTWIEPWATWPAAVTGRAWGALTAWCAPVVDYVLPPRKGARIELTIGRGYLNPVEKGIVSAIINTKIPISDSIEQWSMVGRHTRAVWTIAKRPPSKVKLADILTRIDQLPEDRYALGIGSGGEIVTVSLDLDSPHVCLSARSGSGKSNTVALVVGQVLRRGGRVIMLDLKGSHPELKDHPNVDYCLTAEQCHHALIKAAAEAKERNILSFHEGTSGWQRVMVVAEEANMLIPELRSFWSTEKGPGDPNIPPSIAALRSLSASGRSALYNLMMVAQYLSANAAGGAESRENFGAKLAARPSANMWKSVMGIRMPRISGNQGRWYLVVDEEIEEVQVAYMRPGDLASLATAPLIGPSSTATGGTAPREHLTLREAVDAGVFGGSSYVAVKSRWHRSAERPTPVAKRGQADVFALADMKAFAAANPGSAS